MTRSLHRLPSLVALGLLVLASCDPTSGRMVPFTVESGVVADAPPTPSNFVTDTGWNVTLDKGLVAVGPAYFFANASAIARAPRRAPGALERLYGLVIPTARAHPGDDFFAGGEALGEWPDQWVLDATAPAMVVLGETAGIEGQIRSASILLQPPTAPNASAHPGLGGRTAAFAGRALKDGLEVRFEVALDYPATFTEQLAAGIATDVQLAEGTRVRLALDVPALFSGVEFGELTTEVVPEGHRIQQLLRINLRRAGSWQVTGEAAATP